jgi:hypothetical protein
MTSGFQTMACPHLNILNFNHSNLLTCINFSLYRPYKYINDIYFPEGNTVYSGKIMPTFRKVLLLPSEHSARGFYCFHQGILRFPNFALCFCILFPIRRNELESVLSVGVSLPVALEDNSETLGPLM